MGWRRRFRKWSRQQSADALPQPLKWRPRVRILGLISGAIGGLGAVILIQQYGVAPLGRALTIQGVGGGLLSGIVVPSTIWAAVVGIHNGKLRRACSAQGIAYPPVRTAAPSVAAVLLVLGGAVVAVTTLAARPAAADLTGSCLALANGQDIRNIPVDKDNAIQLESGGALAVTVGAPIGVDKAEIGIKYFGQVFVILSGEEEPGEDSGPDEGDGGSITLEFDNDDLALLGTGLYEFYGFAELSDGSECTGAFLYNVAGDPMDTLLGRTAAGMSAVGALGLVGMSLSGVREGARYVRELQTILVDLDGDGRFDASGYDTDGDGLIDTLALDTDGDGVVDQVAWDSTGDGEIDSTGDDDGDDGDDSEGAVTLRLTHPAGPSPSIFDEGWVFGVRCIAQTETGPMDLSDQVQWGGTATYASPVGRIGRPVFEVPGPNTIELSVDVDGERHEKVIPVNVVTSGDFVGVGDNTAIAHDAHGCPACPHPVVGEIHTGSPTVTVRGRPASRVGDTGIHSACCGPNTMTITGGDPRVLIDGRPAARRGSSVDHCGGTGVI